MQEHTVYTRLITTLIYDIHLFAATFLSFFLKVFNLKGKDASRSAGNWFQFMIVLLYLIYPNNLGVIIAC
jgi:phosphoglycerol transferase MdoB-like AlkP superfamily enzyme